LEFEVDLHDITRVGSEALLMNGSTLSLPGIFFTGEKTLDASSAGSLEKFRGNYRSFWIFHFKSVCLWKNGMVIQFQRR